MTPPAPDPRTLARVYQLGLLTDSLRDTTRQLLELEEVPADTTAAILGRYGDLRAELSSVLADQAGADLLTWTPDPVDGSHLTWAFYACAALGSYVDTVLATPGFVAAYQLGAAQAQAQTSALAAGRGPGRATAGADRGQPGQYL